MGKIIFGKIGLVIVKAAVSEKYGQGGYFAADRQFGKLKNVFHVYIDGITVVLLTHSACNNSSAHRGVLRICGVIGAAGNGLRICLNGRYFENAMTRE